MAVRPGLAEKMYVPNAYFVSSELSVSSRPILAPDLPCLLAFSH